MAEIQVAPLVWTSKDGEQWLLEIWVEPEPGSDRCGPSSRCISLRVSPGPDPYTGAEGGVTATLMRELPVGALLDQARSYPDRREALEGAFFGGMVLDVLITTNVIAVMRDDNGVVIAAKIAKGPLNHQVLGAARLDKVPREPAMGRIGAPPVSRDFLAEIGQVHRLAALLRLPKMRTLKRYLQVRIAQPVSEKTIGRYVTDCRRFGLL